MNNSTTFFICLPNEKIVFVRIDLCALHSKLTNAHALERARALTFIAKCTARGADDKLRAC